MFCPCVLRVLTFAINAHVVHFTHVDVKARQKRYNANQSFLLRFVFLLSMKGTVLVLL